MPEESNNSKIFGGFLLGIYSYIGFLILLLGHGLWHDCLMELNLLTMTPLYEFSFQDGILWSAYISPCPFLIFLITKNHKRLFAKILRTKNSENMPLVVALSNTSIIYITFIILAFFIKGLLHPFNLSFIFIAGSLIGFSSFLYTCAPAWKMLKYNDENRMIEVLKLEHDWIWRTIQTIAWITVILMVSTFYTTWTQGILPLVPPEARNTWTFIKLQTWGVIQAIYLISGLWFGILSRLMEYSWQIRKKIATLDSETMNVAE